MSELIAVVGTMLGAGIGAAAVILNSMREAGDRREERREAETERARVRLEEASRVERRARVQPVRDAIDSLVTLQYREALARWEIEKLVEQGFTRDDATQSVMASADHQQLIRGAFQSYHVVFARSPAMLGIKLIEFVNLLKEPKIDNARLTIYASRVHDAIEEYIAAGTVDGKSPNVEADEERIAAILTDLEAQMNEKLQSVGMDRETLERLRQTLAR
jgi:hypothetical protein